MKALTIFGVVLLFCSFVVSGSMFWWTYRTFYPPLSGWTEITAKPWLPWIRLAFSSIMTVGMLTVSVFVVSKAGRHWDD